MSIRSELLKSARNLVDDFGYPLTITRVTGTTYDPATGTNTESITTATIIGLILKYRKSELDGNMILSDDRKLIVKGGVVVPKVNDRVSGVGGTMRIVRVQAAAPSLTDDMFYVCQVRA